MHENTAQAKPVPFTEAPPVVPPQTKCILAVEIPCQMGRKLGEGGIRTLVACAHPLSRRRRCDRFGTSPHQKTAILSAKCDNSKRLF
jgi:hypothetical protein